MNQSEPAPARGSPEVIDAPKATNNDGKSSNLVAQLEALLFVADEPIQVTRLAEALEVPVDETESALEALDRACDDRGIRLQRFSDRVQLTTAPEMASHIERFLGLELHSKLSTAALEALSIVAYQQPVTRAEIEAIRGVNSDSVLRTLLSKGLIEEAGRLETVGRPILYATTFEFLQFFGLESLEDLPEIDLETPNRTAEEQVTA
jgi:segregation and condensation protein B